MFRFWHSLDPPKGKVCRFFNNMPSNKGHNYICILSVELNLSVELKKWKKFEFCAAFQFIWKKCGLYWEKLFCTSCQSQLYRRYRTFIKFKLVNCCADTIKNCIPSINCSPFWPKIVAPFCTHRVDNKLTDYICSMEESVWS